MPILLGPDGPSLGGFVCPATVVSARALEARPAAPRRHGALRRASARAAAAAGTAAPAARHRRRPATAASSPAGRESDDGAPAVDLPPPGRRPPAGRVPAQRRSTSACGCGSTPSPSAIEAERQARRCVELTAGIRSLQVRLDPAAAHDRARRVDGVARARGRAAADRRPRACPAAPSTCPSPGTTRRPARRSDRYMSGVRADAPWCPWNIEFIRRVNGLDSVEEVRRDRLRRRVPGARPRRRLPRRPGGHAARSAPPPGHHQVQPGPHLDAGERGRDRRRLPLRLRDGGAGRLPVRRPHDPGLEQPRRRSARSSRRTALAAAELRPDPLVSRSRPRSCWSCASDMARGRGSTCGSRTARFRLAEHEAFLAREADEHRPASASASAPPSPPSAPPGRPRASSAARRPHDVSRPRASVCRLQGDKGRIARDGGGAVAERLGIGAAARSLDRAARRADARRGGGDRRAGRRRRGAAAGRGHLRGQGQHRRRRDCRPPPPARPSPTRPRSSAHRGRAAASRPARSSSARPTSTSSPPAWSAPAPPTARSATRAGPSTSPAAPAPARRWPSPSASSTSPSAPTPPARAGCRPPSRASSA